MATIRMKKQARSYLFPNWQQLSLKIPWIVTQTWVNTNLPEFQDESVREIVSIRVN